MHLESIDSETQARKRKKKYNLPINRSTTNYQRQHEKNRLRGQKTSVSKIATCAFRWLAVRRAIGAQANIQRHALASPTLAYSPTGFLASSPPFVSLMPPPFFPSSPFVPYVSLSSSRGRRSVLGNKLSLSAQGVVPICRFFFWSVP